MKNKIVHIIIGLNVGGAELMLKRLVENSNDELNNIIISLTDEGEIGMELMANGVDVYCLRLTKINFIWLGPMRLIRLLKMINPSVVQTWMYHSDLLGGVCAKLVGINRIIWSIRSTDIDKGGSKITVLIRKVLSVLSYVIPNKIVCAATRSKDIHIEVGYDSSKMIVIPNGFMDEKFHYDKNHSLDLFRTLDLNGKFVITSIGRYHPIKNHRLFVEACDLLSKSIPRNNFLFLMVGRDINYKNSDLSSWIEQCEFPDKFILLDERQDIKEILSLTDIYCLHSLSEGFPNVLGEAMCLEKVCISTDVGDARYILNDQALISSSDSLEEYYEIMKKAFSLSEKEKKLVSKRNKNRMENEFSMDRVKKLYINLYNK